MKVLLVNPHDTSQGGFSNAPLGLLYLASAVRDIAEVKISDGYVVGKYGIFKDIDEFQPDIVGITCYTPGRQKALEIAKYAKDKGCKTILGGPHPSLMATQIFAHYPFVDIIVEGEGEWALRDIVLNNTIEKNLYREPLIKNLDDIKFPAWDIIDLMKYPGGSGEHNGVPLGEPRIPIIFSRGCTGHCNFCSTWHIWRKYRTRSPGNMVDEIELLMSMGHHHFVFEDDAMTCDLDNTKAMLKEIGKRNLRIAFHSTLKVDSFDQELADLLRLAGCYGISIGIESGSQKMLKSIGKTILLDDTRRMIAQAKKSGLAICALTMVGNPGETDETINETISFLKELKVTDIGTIGCVWVLPGTAIYRKCLKDGLITDEFWLGEKEVFVYKEPQFKDYWHGKVCTLANF